MTQYRLSVAIGTYSGAAFLREQLCSIAAQSLPVDEIVICDDCSTDTTCEVIEAFSREHPGVVRLYRNSARLGYPQNFARAIELCWGDIIFLSDQDDVWLSTRVERMTTLLALNDGCDVVAAAANITDRALTQPGRNFYLCCNLPPMGRILFRLASNDFQPMVAPLHSGLQSAR